MPRLMEMGTTCACTVVPIRAILACAGCPHHHRRWDNRFAIAPTAHSPDDGQFLIFMRKRRRREEGRAS